MSARLLKLSLSLGSGLIEGSVSPFPEGFCFIQVELRGKKSYGEQSVEVV